jgi:hypothetical protein
MFTEVLASTSFGYSISYSAIAETMQALWSPGLRIFYKTAGDSNPDRVRGLPVDFSRSGVKLLNVRMPWSRRIMRFRPIMLGILPY